MNIINGKRIAAEIRLDTKEQITARGMTPCLAVVLVGENPESVKYVNSKERAALEVGVKFHKVELPADAPKEFIIATAMALSADPEVNGIIVQLPLPRSEETSDVLAAIDQRKDADGMTKATRDLLKIGRFETIPVVCRVVMRVLDEARVSSRGKVMAMVVKSPEPYEAFETIFKANGATPMKVHPADPELGAKLKTADIIVSLPGSPGLIKADMVKPGAVVIDYDYPDASVDFDAVKETAGAITPVPGGCGPMTVAYLLKSTFELALRQPRKKA